MIHPIVPLDELPELVDPVLIAAFAGWNDAGEAASRAMAAVTDAFEVTGIATVDGEALYDYQATRPLVSTTDGGERVVRWPSVHIDAVRTAGARDLVLVSGDEPNLRWQGFTAGVVDLAVRLDVRLAVTLGALQVDRPHTRAIVVSGAASREELATRARIRASRYEGPTGITGVLGSALSAAGLDHVSLWAGVPHYLAGTEHLAAVLALLERLNDVVGLEVPLDQLATGAADQADDIQRLLGEDDDLAEYVADLERRAPDEELVDGEHLAAEFERYLRGRNGG